MVGNNGIARVRWNLTGQDLAAMEPKDMIKDLKVKAKAKSSGLALSPSRMLLVLSVFVVVAVL